MNNALTMILAGGEGKRLFPLSKERAKPAVPFGGRYRIMDFVLSNFVNSGFYKIKVLTQFRCDSLNRQLSLAWRLSPILDHYIEPVSPQMKTGEEWYKGSADAVYQNLNLIYNENCDRVCVFGADHIYKMDVRQKMDFHNKMGADLTISAIPVSVEEAKEFGVIEVDEDWKVVGFEEKPDNPKTIPGNPEMALVSMGNYIFNTDVLVDSVIRDSRMDSSHDFGKDILPILFTNNKVYAYNFKDNNISGMSEKERGYWRDVGSIDAYWNASLDLINVSPIFSLYNENWPIRSYYPPLPPAKFVFSGKEEGRIGIATDSLVSEGCIVSGGQVDHSILSPMVRINSYAQVSESILMEGVNVGRYAKIKKAIIDKFVNIPPHMEIGYNEKEDREKFYVSPNGVIVIPKNANLGGIINANDYD